MKTYRVFLPVAVFAAGVALWSGVGSTAQVKTDPGKAAVVGQLPSPRKWEYKVAPLGREDAEAELNKLGDEGWELAAASDSTSAVQGGGAIRTNTRLIFKRVKR